MVTSDLRKTGISAIGDLPWGSHLCFFYETRQDLFDIAASFFTVGFRSNEFCLLIVSDTVNKEEAKAALRRAIPEIDRFFAAHDIEIVTQSEWFLQDGVFDQEKVLQKFDEKLVEALAKKYEGMRALGYPEWLKQKGWKNAFEFEQELDALIAGKQILLLCSYPLADCSAADILDVAHTHQFALAKRHGDWEVLETPELMETKTEIQRLNEELERRVAERTRELTEANEELKREIAVRKSAEEALVENQFLLQEAQRLAHIGNWNWDLINRTITWSDEIYRIFGFQPQEFEITRAVMDRIPSEDRERIMSIIERSLRQNGPYDFYYRVIRPNGEERSVHSYGSVIREEDGTPLRVFGTTQDITERTRAEQALRQREQELKAERDNLREIIAQAPTLIAVTRGPEHVFQVVNARAYEFLGRRDLIGKSKREALPELEGQGFFEISDEVYRTGKPYKGVNRPVFLRREPGGPLEERYVDLIYQPLFGPDGSVTGIFALGVDNTERSLAEKALRESEERYHSTFDWAPLGIVTVGLDGQIIDANNEFCVLFGYSEEELERLSLRDIYSPDESSRTQDLQHRLLRGDVETDSADRQIRRKDDTYLWASRTVTLLRDAGGNPKHFIGTFKNIEDRKQMEETLLESNAALQSALIELEQTQNQVIQQERLRAVGEMASGIAHDVNNALAPISGFSELLLLRSDFLSDVEKTKRYLSHIVTAAQDAAHTISRLKEFYRPREEGEEFGSVDLAAIAAQVIELTEPRWRNQAQGEGKQIEVVGDLEDVPAIAGNEADMREALTNLIFNAVDAIDPPGGVITVATRRDENRNMVRLEIRDTGQGMSQVTRLRCLEPFYTTKGEQGTGLGLSVVYGIVQRHSGAIEIESEEEVGTTFRLLFPAQTEVISSETVEEKKETVSTVLNILFVDDDALIREMVSDYLSERGHTVTAAEDGERGLALFDDRVDLVITDRAMPKMNGEQLAEALKERRPEVPVILMTGFGEFMAAKGERPAGVDFILSKPVSLQEIEDAVAKIAAPKQV
jgi:PAS domain S-box-containing protein